MADKATAKPSTVDLSVADLLDKFLDWCERNRCQQTFVGYRTRLQSFINWATHLNPSVLPATSLKPYQVVDWLDSFPNWKPATRRNAIASILRAYIWAEELGYIALNPIRKIKKPSAGRREQAVSPAEWVKIRDSYPDGDPFRDVLEFASETGCRPQEVRRIENRHIDLEHHRVVFPAEESKGKKRARVIHTTPRAEAILVRRLITCPTGVVFVNVNGHPWTAFAMNCRFCRLKKRLGVKFAVYSLRHGFATRMLVSGVDHLTVAALMGHADGTMVAKTYSHISDRESYLRDQLLKSVVD